MFRAHQGAKALRVDVDDEEISASASCKDGKLLLTLANLSYSKDKEILLDGCCAAATLTLLAPSDPTAYNDFDAPQRVRPVQMARDTAKLITLPKGAVMAISMVLEEYQ